jgi:hypothetical protein
VERAVLEAKGYSGLDPIWVRGLQLVAVGQDLAGGRSENQEAVRDAFEESHLDRSGPDGRAERESNEKAQPYATQYP